MQKTMGKHGYGTRHEEGSRIVEMAQTFRLAIVNIYYTKKDQQLITYSSGNNRTQIDCILFQRDQVKNVIDSKTLPRESVAKQHRPVVCKVKVKSDLKGDKDWNTVSTNIRTVAIQVLRESLGNKKEGKEAWWWNSEVQEAVKLKRECKKAKTIKNADCRTLNKDEEISDQWRKYFKELMNIENESERRNIMPNTVNEEVATVSSEEVRSNQYGRVIDRRLRNIVDIYGEKFGFMQVKGTTDAIYAFRLLMEKYREVQKELHCVFIDLEKACD
ncbi:uncharacterized protein LOC119598434 [Penaeus monodon]|uniref:uncharacterized protein LOC119598434 n=1 Tax=Penaeus monodon TaxID=6687 RepID=UPI0018A71B6E|nr:uncharacterized protein LOC119598434 [Penaeus monodon]